MKADKTSTIALVAAAIILLAVGAISYHDYIKAKYEKEFEARVEESAEKEALVAAPEPAPQPPEPAPQPPEPTPQPPAPAPQTQPVAAQPAPANNGQPPAVPATVPQPTGNVSPPIAGGVPPAPPSGNAVPAAPAPSNNSRLGEYQANLNALREENSLYQDKLAQKNGDSPLPAPAPLPQSAVAAVGGQPSVTEPAAPRPASPKPATELTPAQVQQEMESMADQVRKAPAIAKVLEYDADWAFLILNGGRDRNIEMEMRFAVRRGAEVLGWIKITEVEQSRSVAQLMSPNKFSHTARKPAPGDDIIAFKLF